MTLTRRAYEMRLLTGAIFSLPVAIVILWYAWCTYAGIDRYRRAADRKQPITKELFQIGLHDELTRDIHRFLLPERPAHSAIPTIELSLSRESLDRLGQDDGPAQEGEASYVHALLKKGNEVREGRVRYRGGQPWHFLGPQKSMKVRVERGELLEGTRAFNLINDPTPFGLEDQIILDLAREAGLLTPEYRPVWVRLNNSDLGVFRYEAQPDEGLIRRSGRMPGNMYSGDADAVDLAGTAASVFSTRKAWRKVADRSEEKKTDERELERLLAAVTGATHEEFATFADTQLELDRYALFDALDVVFGGNEHDWLSNHKFYVDPYTGRLEPVAWSFRGFQHEPALNLVDHPLLIRLKLTPGYLPRRNRAVYELLTEKASVPSIRARVEKLFVTMAPDLAADPSWDAYKLLPKVSKFLRSMPRPMSLDSWVLASEAEIAGFAERSRYLLNVLEEPGIDVRARRIASGTTRIDITLDQEAAYGLQLISFSGACASPSHDEPARVQVWADADLDGIFNEKRDVEVAELELGGSGAVTNHRKLYAGTHLVANADPKPKTGRLHVESEPRTYTYFARAEGCGLDSGALVLDNFVTGGSTRLGILFSKTTTASSDLVVSAASSLGHVRDVPRFEPGEHSAHVWEFAEPPSPEVISIGPGKVRFDQSVRYSSLQTVRIAPRTEIALGPGASLLFHGPVFAEGPLSIVRASPEKPYGGIALQGKGTAGSRLSGLRMRGGSRVHDDVIDYSGLINVHDTSNVVLADLTLVGDGDSEDVVHANSVAGLELHEVSVTGAPVDAIDLELTKAELRGIRVIGAGDDCLDIGGSEVRIRDSVLAACTNNGVSAGEQSEVSLHGLLIARAKTGVLAKNETNVRATRSVIWESDVALKTNFKELYYSKKSSIGASEMFAVRCGAIRDAARGTTIEAGSVQVNLPDENALRHLLVNVLRLERWTDLEGAIAELDQGAPK